MSASRSRFGLADEPESSGDEPALLLFESGPRSTAAGSETDELSAPRPRALRERKSPLKLPSAPVTSSLLLFALVVIELRPLPRDDDVVARPIFFATPGFLWSSVVSTGGDRARATIWPWQSLSTNDMLRASTRTRP